MRPRPGTQRSTHEMGVFRPRGCAPSLRVPVDVKAMMDSLAKQREWPCGLRVTVTVRLPGSAQALAQAAAELPITPGD